MKLLLMACTAMIAIAIAVALGTDQSSAPAESGQATTATIVLAQYNPCPNGKCPRK